MSTAKQRTQLAEFVATASASEAQAQRYLSRHKWNSDAALNAFFDSGERPEGAPAASAVSPAAITATFERLAKLDPPGDALGMYGFVALASELGVDMACVRRRARRGGAR